MKNNITVEWSGAGGWDHHGFYGSIEKAKKEIETAHTRRVLANPAAGSEKWRIVTPQSTIYYSGALGEWFISEA